MKFLGILRASALCLLVSGLHSPNAVFCSNIEVNPYTEVPTVEVPEISEKPKESTVNTGDGAEGDLAVQVRMLQAKLQALEAGLGNASEESSTDDIKDSTVESLSEASSPASQSDLVFKNPIWDDSYLASAVLFLKEFCKEVKAEKFSTKLSEDNYEDLSMVCSRVYYTLESANKFYIPTYGPGSVDKRKEIPKKFYKDALKPEEFTIYLNWLAENIAAIIKSYKKMHNETRELTKDQRKTETSVGPLKYGFVYGNVWWGEIRYPGSSPKYADPVLLLCLKDLHTRLDIILNDPEDSAQSNDVLVNPSSDADSEDHKKAEEE
ncbi:secreted antigen 1 [Babesia divergens]|uniref:Secreted antigen 1 n=1 Tax=Babesia divergens TaxID=32595 RepID=A0AAD9GFQ2_BABDI|nr:secreted antigen 1 [Babesia divergens]